MIFDTHAHYDDEAFDEDREQLLAAFKENGDLVHRKTGRKSPGYWRDRP